MKRPICFPEDYIFEASEHNRRISKANRIALRASISFLVSLIVLSVFGKFFQEGRHFSDYLLIVAVISYCMFCFIWFAGFFIDRRYKLQKSNLFFIPFFTIGAVFLLYEIIYGSSLKIESDNYINFISGILPFVGTFDLGYFIYIQGCIQNDDKKRNCIRYLLATVGRAEEEVHKLYEELKADGFRESIDIIEYDKNWRLNYYQGASLIEDDSSVEETLEWFFREIEAINMLITRADSSKIQSKIEVMEEYDNKSMRSYNLFEAKNILLESSNRYSDKKSTRWLDDEKVIRQINELCRKYYSIIENMAYAFLMQERDSDKNMYDLLYDWLVNNSKEFSEIAGKPPDRRIVYRVIFDCAIQMNQRSSLVDYCWGAFHIRT